MLEWMVGHPAIVMIAGGTVAVVAVVVWALWPRRPEIAAAWRQAGATADRLSAEVHDDRIDEAHRLLSGHAGAGSAVKAGPGDEWLILPRRWGPNHWDATVLPPRPAIGWSLGGPFDRTEEQAIERAKASIRRHLGITAYRGER